MEPINESPDGILKKFVASIPAIKAAALISTEGLPIASVLPEEVDETKIAGMTASLLSLAENSVMELRKGELDQIIVKWGGGVIIVLQVGPNAILVVSLTDIRSIFILYEMKLLEQIRDILQQLLLKQ